MILFPAFRLLERHSDTDVSRCRSGLAVRGQIANDTLLKYHETKKWNIRIYSFVNDKGLHVYYVICVAIVDCIYVIK
jgi:hypothetical protein